MTHRFYMSKPKNSAPAEIPTEPTIRIHKHSSHEGALIIERSIARDDRLSWAARGLLIYILSLPSGQEISEARLYEQAPFGRHQLHGAIIELEGIGHLASTQGGWALQEVL